MIAELNDYIVDVVNYPSALPGTARYEQQMLAFIDENERVLLSQVDAAIRLMRSKPWQFFMIALMATDRLGHYCWKFSDPALESSLATEEQKRIGARCRAMYRQIDAQLARLLDGVGPDCALIVVSDHASALRHLHFSTQTLASRARLSSTAYRPGTGNVCFMATCPAREAKLRTPVDSKYGW